MSLPSNDGFCALSFGYDTNQEVEPDALGDIHTESVRKSEVQKEEKTKKKRCEETILKCETHKDISQKCSIPLLLLLLLL